MLALVTGASSGIGEAVAKRLAQEGFNLIVHGRNVCRLEKLKGELQVEVEIVVADLGDPVDRQKVIEAIHQKVPDLVVNNAGFGLYGNAVDYPTKEQLQILRVNGEAVLEIALEAARTMIANKKKGVIMNISSSGGFQMFPGFAVYVASKAFLNNFTESFDEELKPHGIRCLASCPGVVETRFQKRASGGKERTVPLSMTPEFAANEIWWQIQKGKTLHIFDWKYRFFVFLGMFVPRSIRSKILKKIIADRLD